MVKRFSFGDGFYGADVGVVLNVAVFDHSDDELDQLERLLKRSLAGQKHQIERAAWRLVNETIFPAAAVSQTELNKRLSQIASGANNVLSALRDQKDPRPNAAQELIRSFLYTSLYDPEDGITLDVILDGLSTIAYLAGGAATDYAAGPGRVGSPGVPALKSYLRRLAMIGASAKASLTLPTNERRDIDTTPFLEFVSKAIHLASEKGESGIRLLQLSQSQTEAALDALDRYARPSTRSLIDNLRPAIQAAKATHKTAARLSTPPSARKQGPGNSNR